MITENVDGILEKMYCINHSGRSIRNLFRSVLKHSSWSM